MTKHALKIFVLIVAVVVLARLPGLFGKGPGPSLVIAPGYRVVTWAKKLGQPRLMVATATRDLIVSTYRDGTVLLLKKDADGDGVSDGKQVLLSGLNMPHGLVLEKDTLYLAEEHRVSQYHFDGNSLTKRKTILANIPEDGGHNSRTLKRGPDGWFYLSIGSSCNVCIEEHPWRASIIRFKIGTKSQVYAKGLRNTVGFDWHPVTDALYGVNAGSDLLGDDIPPEEMNLIEQGKHYGWPYVHSTKFKDPRYGPKTPKTLTFTPPVHSFTAHSTPLSIRFLKSKLLPTALVGRHGSWNRSEKSGYDVVKLIWQPDGTISQSPFLTGFVKDDNAIGRPVDVLQVPDGSIFISDDEAGVIYKVQAIK